MRGKRRGGRNEGNNNGTARMLVFECRSPGGAAGYVRGGCSQAGSSSLSQYRRCVPQGGAGLRCLGRPGTPATLRAAHRQQRRLALAPARICTVVREHGSREQAQRVAVAAAANTGMLL
jgi:hypothetical protein